MCIYVQYTNILFRYKVLVSPRLAHTHVPPTFTPHTKRARASRAPTTVPMGRALRARPIGTVIFPFVCGVNVGSLLCGTCVCVCFPSSASARLCGARVLDDVRRGLGSAAHPQSPQPSLALQLQNQPWAH